IFSVDKLLSTDIAPDMSLRMGFLPKELLQFAILHDQMPAIVGHASEHDIRHVAQRLAAAVQHDVAAFHQVRADVRHHAFLRLGLRVRITEHRFAKPYSMTCASGIRTYGVPRLTTANNRCRILHLTALITDMGALPCANFRW